MNTRRFEIALPLIALVISFFAVMALGRAFALEDRNGAPVQTTSPQIDVPTTSSPPSPSSTPPSGNPSSTPGTTGIRIEITIAEPATQESPAPGLLERSQVEGQPPRVCMVSGLTDHWTPEDRDQWTEEAGTLCREAKANQPSGELVLTWVRR